MFQAASCAPTDGRPVLWIYGDGSGGSVMFCRHGLWWDWDEGFDGNSCACMPYADIDRMRSSDWLWIDLPHSILARSMIAVVAQMAEIDRAKNERTGYYRKSEI